MLLVKVRKCQAIPPGNLYLEIDFMFSSLTLAAAMLLAQPGGSLELSNIRNTYGELGGARPDGKLLPGDVLFIGFDIDGVTIQPDGRVEYSMALEVTDAKGKSIFKQAPADKFDFVPLGGKSIPGRAFITIGLDQPAGSYTLKVTVVDKGSKATKSFDKKFEVSEPDFGIVGVYPSADDRGAIPAPTTCAVGQSIYVQFGIVGFGRADSGKSDDGKQPNVITEMQILDEKGQPTIEKHLSYTLDGGLDEDEPTFSLRFLLPMTRTGKFTARLKATDKVANKTATFDLPISVVPLAN